MFEHLRYLLEGNIRVMGTIFVGRPIWSIDNLPNLSGKVAMVTGANVGIGFQIAKGLLMKNATVYLGVRNVIKGNEALKKLREETGNENVHLLQMDLSDMLSVKKAVMEFQISGSKLHMLYNNAGLMVPPMDQFTTQGYDLQFGTNVLGHYLLTKLLLPTLESTAATASPADPVRIIEFTSSVHFVTPNTGANIISYETLKGESNTRTRMGGLALYSQSKSANILVAKARARLLKGYNIISLSVHPGHIESELHRSNHGIRSKISHAIQYPGPMGAITPLYAGAAPETAQANGKFFVPWCREERPRSDHIDNIAAEDKLVAWLEEQIKVNDIM